MKLKILKKNIKEGEKNGNSYSIKSLFVSFSESAIYEAVVSNLKAQGAPSEKIEKFCSPNEYNGNVSYAFWLNCSDFTFNNVDRFGILDAKIIFTYAETGFVNAKIQVVDRKEQVNSYQQPEQAVEGWSSGNPTPSPTPEVTTPPIGHPENQFFPPKAVDVNSLDPKDANDLPF
jgi:hypothetical protein